MTIKVGDRIPEAKFRVMTAEGPGWKTTDEVFKGKKVVLFAVPGAFTPTCHKNHLPGFLSHADAIKAKGVDTIAVTAVNDVFVMTEWRKASGAEGKIEFLADGNGDFAKALDLTMDGSAGGSSCSSSVMPLRCWSTTVSSPSSMSRKRRARPRPRAPRPC